MAISNKALQQCLKTQRVIMALSCIAKASVTRTSTAPTAIAAVVCDTPHC